MNNKHIDKIYRKYKRLFQQFEVINKLAHGMNDVIEKPQKCILSYNKNRSLKYKTIEIEFVYQERNLSHAGNILFCFYKKNLHDNDEFKLRNLIYDMLLHNKTTKSYEYSDCYILNIKKYNYKNMKDLYNIILNFNWTINDINKGR